MIDARTTIGVFRDCLKLIPRMVNEANKVHAARVLVRREFERHRDVFDPDQIYKLKMNNYLIYTIQTEQKLNPSQSVFEPESDQEEIEEGHEQAQRPTQEDLEREEMRNRLELLARRKTK